MIGRSMLKLGVIASLGVAVVAIAGGALAQQPQQRDLQVTPCDGGGPTTVVGYKAGEKLSPERAQQLANQLMDGWLARQPDLVAAAWVRERDAALAAAPQAAPPPASETPNAQHVDFSTRDYMIWEKELDREIAYGDKIFHDDKLLESPEGVSCAMCHPNASNTHPETYPKFQTQLKRVALLRDMINWCIENPVRGKKLADDDPKMRALEAYIIFQRKGVPLDAGKH